MGGENLDTNSLCMGCMREKGSYEFCPKCGWSDKTQNINYGQLPLRTILNKRYLIGKPLGSGGFGITYLAWDTTLDMKLAIKEYFPKNIATRALDTITISMYSTESTEDFSYGRMKFLDEAKMIAKFNESQNIVSVIDFFEENGTAYIVMNYIEGVTLKEYVAKKGGKLPYNEAIELILPILDALTEVHEAGILHRDISPDNIYITQSNQVKLLDFGNARASLGIQNATFSVILKHGYAPIEQYYRNGNQGPWTDVYSAAATFYKLLTGIIPQESIERTEADKLVPPSANCRELPKAIERVLMKALSVKISDRYQSMREFKNALLNAYTCSDVTTTSDNSNIPSNPNNSEAARPIKKKRKKLLPFVAILTLILILSLAGYYQFIYKNSESNSTKKNNSDLTPSTGTNTDTNSDSNSTGPSSESPPKTGEATNNNPSSAPSQTKGYFSDVYKPFYHNFQYETNEVMTLASRKYFKGFKVSSSGTDPHYMSFNLEGKIDTISGLIGLDDAKNKNDSIAEFYGDGKSLATFNLKKGGLPQKLNLNVKGVTELKLKISCYNATVDLANLLINEPTIEYPNDGYLDNISGKYASDVLKPYYYNIVVSYDKPMKMGSYEYYKGYKIKSTSSSSHLLSFNLEGKLKTMSGIIGIDDTDNKNDVAVAFYGDDQPLATYNIKKGSLSQKLELNLQGVTKLDIKISGYNVTVDLADLIVQ